MGKKKTKKKEWYVKLVLGKEEQESEGGTLFEALQGLKRPQNIFLNADLKIKHGDKERLLLMVPTRLKRLFYENPVFLNIQANLLAKGLE